METIKNIHQLPKLDGDAVHIWGIHVPDMLDRLDSLESVLCKEERVKAARFRRKTDRQSSICARGALRILLSGYTETSALDIVFRYSKNGKPHLADSGVNFNVSHSGDWVVLAMGHNRSIGVDVEKIKREIDVLPIASRYFTLPEIELIKEADDPHEIFFQTWARKEAFVKASGSTLFNELSAFSVPLEDTEKEGWHFRRLEAGSKYAAAVVTDKPMAHVPCYDFGELKWDS